MVTFSLATNPQKIWFPQIPLEITVRNKVPSRKIPAGTLFLTVFSRGTLGNNIFEK
jgi:hypothetical protein